MPHPNRSVIPPELITATKHYMRKIDTAQTELTELRAARDSAIEKILELGFTPGDISRELGISRQAVREVELARRRRRTQDTKKPPKMGG